MEMTTESRNDLLRSVRSDAVDMVREAMLTDADFLLRSDGWTLLHEAALYNASQVCVVLGERFSWSPIATIDGTSLSPLHVAIQEQSVDAVRVLLPTYGEFGDEWRSQLTSPILVACFVQSTEILSLILDQDPNCVNCIRSEDEWTCFHVCAHVGFLGGLELLVERLSAHDEAERELRKIDHRDKFGRTPLFLAVEAAVQQKMHQHDHGLEHTATNPDHEAPDIEGASCLACSHSTPQHVKTSFHRIAEFLLLHGANPNARSIRGVCPLLLCARVGDLSLFDLLVRFGADVSQSVSDDGISPLHWAANFGHEALVDRLLSLDVEVHARTRFGELASELARFAGFESIAQSIEIHALTSDPDVTALL